MAPNEDKLKARFRALVERVRATPHPGDSGPFKVSIRFPRKADVALRTGDAADMYEQVLQAFFATYAPTHDSPISRREVKGRFDRAIQNALGPKGQGQVRRTTTFHRRLVTETRVLFTALNAPSSQWRVYIPIRAPLVARATKFGVVEFLPGSGTVGERLRRALPNVASAFDVDTIARLHVNAVDGNAAQAIGIQRLRHTLDVLDFLEPVIEAPYLDEATTFESVDAPGESAVVATRAGLASHSTIRFFVRPRTLGARGEQASLERSIDALLRYPKPSSLKRRLSTALAWAGRANVQRRLDQAFLMKIIAVEAALTKADTRNASTERLRLRVAQVLGGSPERRRFAYEQMGTFYHVRSSIVHAGTAGELGETAMAEITGLTREVLKTLLTRSPFTAMSSEEDLERWFERQLLAGESRRRHSKPPNSGF